MPVSTPGSEPAPANAATFDVEDYRQILRLRYQGDSGEVAETFVRDMEAVCELLDRTRTRATFFVTGTVAAGRPELLRRWRDLGHEIAVHGWDHTPIWAMDRRRFREDLRRSRKAVEDAIGVSPLGYRAAVFSVRWDTLWALDEIAACGFAYDSSIVPVRMKRYGVDGFDRATARYRLASGAEIIEFPLPAVPRGPHAKKLVPLGGGGYFRLHGLGKARRAVEHYQREGLPFVMYCHPDELGGQTFRAADLATNWRSRLSAALLSFRSNVGRRRMPALVAALLSEYRFTTLADLAGRIADHAPTRILGAPRAGL